MSYNLLNYPGNDFSTRNGFFGTVISSANPDVLVVQEMISQAGVDLFLNSVLKTIDTAYSAGQFIDGPDSDNAIFFKSTYFRFISNTRIPTSLRDINEFKLVHKITEDTLRIFSVHLKASTGTSNEQQRLSEVNELRNFTDQLHTEANYIVLGDFNIYRSTEPAYLKLLDQATTGYFIDVISMPGTWSNSSYAIYHTQSPRVRSFGGGSAGGLDDRFDMILFSPSVIQSGGVTYINNSYTVYGNDGLHYNDSINRPPNLAVGQTIANALHYASDHLPVYVNLEFAGMLPVELINFNAKVVNNHVHLSWETATEKNNYGFIIERMKIFSFRSSNWEAIGFVSGNGNSNSPKSYSFVDNSALAGKYKYRLKQIDTDGSFTYSETIEVETIVEDFVLYQNYPNPFGEASNSNNPTTKISWKSPQSGWQTLKIYDIIGNEIATLVDEYKEAGVYDFEFNATALPSGVYFYKLIVGDFVDVKKMILIR